MISPFRNFVLSFLIILATVFFALGIILPVIRFTTVYVWTNEHSIATIIWALFENEEYFLTVVLFLFSIFFPFLKLFYLLTLVTSPDIPPEFRKKSISTMEWLGRYSMTDVMVLALMIFYVNSSGYTEATVLPGVYFFAASAIITMFAYGWANSVPVARRLHQEVAISPLVVQTAERRARPTRPRTSFRCPPTPAAGIARRSRCRPVTEWEAVGDLLSRLQFVDQELGFFRAGLRPRRHEAISDRQQEERENGREVRGRR